MSIVTAIETLPAEIKPARAAQLMLWAIAGFFVAILTWAGLANVDEVARATGRVIPSQQLQVISNLEGGIVKDILVRAGQRVSAGQVLVRLDRTQMSAEFGKTSETYNALVARMTRLQAEVSGRSPIFPPGLVASAPALVASERSLYSARIADLASENAAARARLDQASRALGQAEMEAQTRAQALDLARREVGMVGPLVEKGIEPQLTLVRDQSAVEQAASAHDGAVEATHRATGAVAEARSVLRNVAEHFRAQSVDALTATRAELAGQGQSLPALKDRVTRTELRAPIAGIVNRVLVTTVGGTVRSGEPLIEVVPEHDALVVEAQVKPADIAFVHPGQRALVKLTAYDYTVYGGLRGSVERISPDAVVNERTGDSHFTIRVRTDQNRLRASDGAVLPIGVGMIAEVDILGHKRSVLSYLLTPVSKLSDNAFREK